MSLQNPETEDLIIQTASQTLQGWESIRVTRGVEMMPSSFECHLSERYPGSFTTAIVQPGESCTVMLGGDLVLTGYIDLYEPSYDAHTHNVIIAGRSKCEDVVDSSIVGPPWSTQTGTLSTALKAIMKQFSGVNLVFSGNDPQLTIVVPFNPASSVYEVIEELCRMGGKLLWDDKDGNLVVSDVGTASAGSALVEGQNVERAAARQDWSQRFHTIQTFGQTWSTGNAGAKADYLGKATDGVIRADRVKHIAMDTTRGDFAQIRADWEVSRRMGRSLLTEITVVGWRDGGGTLWTPNTLVSIQCPTLKIEDTFCISECSWIRGQSGTQTIMTLMNKAGLQPQPFAPPTGAGLA